MIVYFTYVSEAPTVLVLERACERNHVCCFNLFRHFAFVEGQILVLGMSSACDSKAV